ncbi:MAG: hypothetical protein ACSLFF_02250 [Solirubrobacterales bacterium]
MSRPVLTYLLWAPFGAGRVDPFVESYSEFAAGIDHELVVAACGDTAETPVAPLLESFAAIPHTVEHFHGERTDLKTYRELVDRRPDANEFVFCNSYSRVLAPNWLNILVGALHEPGVGIVGPGGSFETPVNSLRFYAGLLYLPTFPTFPNPHVRTSCFAITRSSIEQTRWTPEIKTKRATYRLEGGRQSLTRQLQKVGLRPIVVGRDGKSYEIDEWSKSATFRAGGQRNLLVSDLRTENYDDGDDAEKAWLAGLAWGRN